MNSLSHFGDLFFKRERESIIGSLEIRKVKIVQILVKKQSTVTAVIDIYLK